MNGKSKHETRIKQVQNMMRSTKNVKFTYKSNNINKNKNNRKNRKNNKGKEVEYWNDLPQENQDVKKENKKENKKEK